MKIIKVLACTLTLLLSMPSFSEEGDTISGDEIFTESTNIACTDWGITGICIWMTCTVYGCDFDYSIKVKHNIPDVVVSVYKNTGENPWTDVASYSPPTTFATDGGSNSEGASINNEQALRFKNADAIGSPGNLYFEALSSSDYFCEPAQTSYFPYYLSTLDSFWRNPTVETYLTLANFSRGVSNGDTHFGGIFPRIGFVNQGHDYKSAVVNAQRVADFITEENQPHVYWPIVEDSEAGYWPPGKVKEGDEETHLWQQLVPKGNSSECVVFADIDDTGDTDDPFSERINQSTGYAWNLWRPYSCCEREGAVLIYHTE